MSDTALPNDEPFADPKRPCALTSSTPSSGSTSSTSDWCTESAWRRRTKPSRSRIDRHAHVGGPVRSPMSSRIRHAQRLWRGVGQRNRDQLGLDSAVEVGQDHRRTYEQLQALGLRRCQVSSLGSDLRGLLREHPQTSTLGLAWPPRPHPRRTSTTPFRATTSSSSISGRRGCPCRAFAPTFSAAAENHPRRRVRQSRHWAEQELSAAAEIRSIPTLDGVQEGNLIFNQPGALPRRAGHLIRRVRNSMSMRRSPRSQTDRVVDPVGRGARYRSTVHRESATSS